MKYFGALLGLLLLLGASLSLQGQDKKLYPMQKQYKWGFINKKGEWVIKPEFPHVLPFTNGLAAARKPGANQWGYLNKQGEWAIEPQFGNKRAAYRTYAGKRWYSPEIDPFRNNRAAVVTDGSLTVINKKGQPITQFKDYEALRVPKQGRAAFKEEDQWGFLDKRWEVVIEPQYHKVSDFHQGLAYVQKDFGDSYGFINKQGELVIERQYEEVGHFANGLAPAKTGAFEPWGYINQQGEWAIEPQFEQATPFSDGLAFVKNDQNTRFINKKGATVTDCNFDDWKVCDAHSFRNGLAMVSLVRKDSNCGRSMSIFPIERPANSAYAYINKQGEIVYQQPFEDAFYLKNLEDSLERAEKKEEQREAREREKRERQQLADCKEFKAFGDKAAGSYVEIGYMGVRRRFYYNNDVFQKKEGDQYRYHIPAFQQSSGETFLSLQDVGMEPSFFDENQLEVDDLGYMFSLRGYDCIKFPSDATDDAQKMEVEKKEGTQLWKKGTIKYTHPEDSQQYVLIHLAPDQYKRPVENNNTTPANGFLLHDEEKIDVNEVQFKYSAKEQVLEVGCQGSEPADAGGRRIYNGGAEIDNFKQETGTYYNEAVHRFDDHYIEYFKVLAYSDDKVHIKHYRKELSEEDEEKQAVNKDNLPFKEKYLVGEYIGSGIVKAVDPGAVQYNLDE